MLGPHRDEPEVHATLGEDVGPRLDAWIAAHPRRTGTSMRGDTAAFVASLLAAGVTAVVTSVVLNRDKTPGD